MARSGSDQPELVLRALTSRVLWLGATILVMLAGGLIYFAVLTYTTKTNANNLGALIALSLGVNFLTGAVGAALFDLLIKRPQEQQRARVATHSDAELIQGAIAKNAQEIDQMVHRFETIAAFVQQHAKALPLEASNIAEMYPSRALAAQAMHEVLSKSPISEIRIMGISLSDFITTTHGSVWSVIQRYLTGERPLPKGTDKLVVKVLVCDPKSLASHLLDAQSSTHGSAESAPTEEEYKSSLEADFEHVLARLRPLLNRSNSERPSTTFEFRIYREFIHSFLFAAGRTTFVQPYYIHKYEMEEPEMPLMKYDANSVMSSTLVNQFDLMWAQASACPENLIEGKPVRIDGGAARTGIVELYTSASTASAQLERLLRNAKRRILLQGISNVPIIRGELNEAFIEVVNRKDVMIRVLILDPRSEAAKQKTFARYESMRDSRTDAGWDAYRAAEPGRAGAHQSSDIYDNIMISLNWFLRVARDANRVTSNKVRVRICSSVNAFIMVVDDFVLFEPYHFGNEFNLSFPAQTPLQLAGNMPLIEFHPPRPRPFPPRRGENVSSPVEVCVSHFERVFEQFSTDVPDNLFEL